MHGHIDPEFPSECFAFVTDSIRAGRFNLKVLSHAFYLASWVTDALADDEGFGATTDASYVDPCLDLLSALGCDHEAEGLVARGIDGYSGPAFKLLLQLVAKYLIQYIEDNGIDKIIDLITG